MQSKSNRSNTAEVSATERGSDGDASGEKANPPEKLRTADLGLDQVFEVLKNQRRRYVLTYLRDNPGPVQLSDLAEQIAAWENDKEIRTITSSERKRVYVGLYQCHLPKMDGMGVISFNKPRTRIERGAHVDLLYPYLDAPTQQDDDQWPTYYLGLSGGTLFAFVGAAVVQFVTTVPALVVVAGLSTVAFAATALYHSSTQQAPSTSNATT